MPAIVIGIVIIGLVVYWLLLAYNKSLNAPPAIPYRIVKVEKHGDTEEYVLEHYKVVHGVHTWTPLERFGSFTEADAAYYEKTAPLVKKKTVVK